MVLKPLMTDWFEIRSIHDYDWMKLKKNKKKFGMTQWPNWPGKIRSKTQLQPVNFFILKRCHFDLKKFDPDDLMTRLKRESRVLNRVGHRAESENYGGHLLGENSRSVLYILPVVSSSLQLEFPITKFTQISINVLQLTFLESSAKLITNFLHAC
jgi:hypothetical protein